MPVTRPAKLLVAATLALALPQGAMAKSGPGVVCSLATTALMFGDYLPLRRTSADSTAVISVTCTTAATSPEPVTGSIALAGTAPAANRLLSHGHHAIRYQLYADPARSRVWGDGAASGTTVAISGKVSATLPYRQTIRVYGRIAANNPSAAADFYADTITATLDY